jgi:hypothetical protein
MACNCCYSVSIIRVVFLVVAAIRARRQPRASVPNSHRIGLLCQRTVIRNYSMKGRFDSGSNKSSQKTAPTTSAS